MLPLQQKNLKTIRKKNEELIKLLQRHLILLKALEKDINSYCEKAEVIKKLSDLSLYK